MNRCPPRRLCASTEIPDDALGFGFQPAKLSICSGGQLATEPGDVHPINLLKEKPMRRLFFRPFIATILAFGLGPFVSAQPHNHDRFVTKPIDNPRTFTAFKLSFDGMDDGVALGIPEWVAYELRAKPSGLGPAPARPGSWATDEQLHSQGIAPNDHTYRGSGYSRGHMAMKSHASRISAKADRETHTVLNACPQMQSMNAGVWLSLENHTGKWADTYGKVWIVCGPVFYANRKVEWIGDPGEIPAAIPHAFFKIIAKDREGVPDQFDVLAFLVPMYGDSNHSKQTADVVPYATSIDTIETLTGLDFLTSLDDSTENDIEKRVYTKLWTIEARPETRYTTPDEPTRSTSSVQLRAGVNASAQETELATKIKAAGWEYSMPSPKSAQAAWGNSDGRTTWWVGYWKNSNGRSSRTQPKESDGFKGDAQGGPAWRRGGSRGRPSMIEWLCSTSGGIAP